jgi:hypothetical protein
LFAGGLAFNAWRLSEARRTQEHVIENQAFARLGKAHAEMANKKLELPPEPYRLNPTQKKAALECVQKELKSDPDVAKELALEKYCECLELFDEKPYGSLNEEQKAAMFLRHSEACDARHTKSPANGS